MRSFPSILFLLSVMTAAQLHAQPTCTVVTYNIRYDNPRDSLDRWEQRREALAMEVLRQRPQLIGLQEVLAHQANYLDMQWSGYTRYGVGREDGMEKGEFSPVYYDTTAFRLVAGRTIWLSPTPEKPSKGWDAACERIATYVVLFDKRTNDSLFVVNTHWDHEGAEARMNSAAMMVALLAPIRARGGHVLLMGDFNATADTAPMQLLATALKDSAPKQNRILGTFNGFDVERSTYDRIDYVWHSSLNWELLRYEVPHPKVNGRQVSDHFPVAVGLRAR